MREYIQMWEEDEYKQILYQEFGADNIIYDDLNQRITGFHHDRHIVKCILSRLSLIFTLFFLYIR